LKKERSGHNRATTSNTYSSTSPPVQQQQPAGNTIAIPLGTTSIGYLTQLLKQKFDNNNFEESFSTWELELARYERGNNA